MIAIPQEAWKRVVLDGEVTARIMCPGCFQWALLDHVIAPDGKVAPSVVCAFQCGFHEMVQLVGWAHDRN